MNRAKMNLAEHMAHQAIRARNVPLTSELVRAATVCLTDLVGVTVSGSACPGPQRLRRVPGVEEAGDALIYGSAKRVSVLNAALVNGTSGHAEDFDDFSDAFGGHPTVALAPALLALADARRLSGAAVLRAFVTGVEAQGLLADAVHFHHYEKGWHPTATLGVFGAAIGAAELLGLDEARTATAITIAASLSSGLKANFGSDTKPLHAGQCNRNGLFAAFLAEQGFTSNPGALEHHHGFLEVFNGTGHYDVDALYVPWFDVPQLLNPGISIKQFPCCGSTHSSIYAALEIAQTIGPHNPCIQAVQVEVHPRRLPHTDKPMPTNALEAKFSVQYCVARALADGAVRGHHFEGDAFADSRVVALLPKIVAIPSERYAQSDEHGFAATVRVALDDGGVTEYEHHKSPGRGHDNPMSETELRDKFSDCSAKVLTRDGVDRAWDVLRRFEALADVREFTDGLVAGVALSRAA
jgi:2-methylcitrate dehydratase PrpD